MIQLTLTEESGGTVFSVPADNIAGIVQREGCSEIFVHDWGGYSAQSIYVKETKITIQRRICHIRKIKGE